MLCEGAVLRMKLRAAGEKYGAAVRDAERANDPKYSISQAGRALEVKSLNLSSNLDSVVATS